VAFSTDGGVTTMSAVDPTPSPAPSVAIPVTLKFPGEE